MPDASTGIEFQQIRLSEQETSSALEFLHSLTRPLGSVNKAEKTSFQTKLGVLLESPESEKSRLEKAKGLMIECRDEVVGTAKNNFRDGLLGNLMKESLLRSGDLSAGIAISFLFHRLHYQEWEANKNAEVKLDREDRLETSVVVQQLIGKYIVSHSPEEFRQLVSKTQTIARIIADCYIAGDKEKENLELVVNSAIRGNLSAVAAVCFMAGFTKEDAAFPTPILDRLYGIDIVGQNSVGQSKSGQIVNQPSERIYPTTHKVKFIRERSSGRKIAQSSFFELPISKIGNGSGDYEMLFKAIRFVPIRDEAGKIYRIKAESIRYDAQTGAFSITHQPTMVLELILNEVLSRLPIEEISGFQLAQIMDFDSSMIPEFDPARLSLRKALAEVEGYPRQIKEWVQDIMLALAAAKIDPDLRRNTGQILHIQSDLHNIASKRRPEDLTEYGLQASVVIHEMMDRFNIDPRSITGI